MAVRAKCRGGADSVAGVAAAGEVGAGGAVCASRAGLSREEALAPPKRFWIHLSSGRLIVPGRSRCPRASAAAEPAQHGRQARMADPDRFAAHWPRERG
jgi:hypothetical protein